MSDALLSSRGFISNDHIITELKLEDDLLGRLSGAATFTRSTIGTFIDKDTGLVVTAAIDVARFEANGVLIEGPSTNLALRSEEFDNAVWTKSGISVSANSSIAPDGNLTADEIVEDTGSAQHRLSSTVTLISGRTYTVSAFVKRGVGSRHVQLGLSASTSFVRIYFDLTNGTVATQTDGTGTIKDLGNGLFKITATGVSDGIAATVFLANTDGTTVGSETYTGDGVSSIIWWGSQIEELPFASSYIATTSTTVSRTKDVLTLGTSGNFNEPTGTISFILNQFGDKNTDQYLLSVNDGSANNRHALLRSSDKLRTFVANASVTQADYSDSADLTINQSFKITYTYGTNDFNTFKDNVSIGSDFLGNPPSGLSVIVFGANNANDRQLFGHIKDFKIYDIALTAAQVSDNSLIAENNKVDFDFSIAENGDVRQVDFFDTAILVSIYEEKRAGEEEVALPELRRGWIGNESTPDFERGSKIWLYEQSRLTREVINNIISAANESLEWLIEQGFATEVQSDINLRNGEVFLLIDITRPDSITIRRELFLWDNSGITEVG